MRHGKKVIFKKKKFCCSKKNLDFGSDFRNIMVIQNLSLMTESGVD